MKRRTLFEYLAGVVVALVAFAAYLITLSNGAFPGKPASLLCEYTGLIPAMSPEHPLYGAIASLLTFGGVAGAIFRLNFFSVLCGTLCVWMLYEVVYASVLLCIDEEDRDVPAARVAAVVGSVTAALALAFSLPFWTVATRAHSAAFDVMLLLVSAWLLLLYFRHSGLWIALILSLLLGLGFAEFATFILFAPLFGVVLLYLMWQKNDFRPGPVIAMAGCFLLGLSLYLLGAWRYQGTPGYFLRQYTGFWQIVWVMLCDQYLLLTRSLPARGWLIILVVTFVPWATVTLIARRGLNGERDWAYYALHLLLVVLCGAVLIDTPISPWKVAGRERLLVTPYLLVAAVAGYLAAYWYRVPLNWWRDPQEGIREWFRRSLGYILMTPLALLVLAAPIRNFTQCDGRPAAELNRFADAAITGLNGRTWLVTDGSIDEHLLLAAKARGLQLRCIDSQAARSSIYMRYIASLFNEVRLKNLSEVGLLPMLEAWFTTDGAVDKKVAVMNLPDLWESANFAAVPSKVFFVGQPRVATATQKPQAQALMAEHEAWWSEQVPRLRRLAEKPDELGTVGKHLLGHLSLVANNLGVWLEDEGNREGAFASYRKAREIDPDNLSALLNMDAMIRSGYPAQNGEALHKEIEKRASGKDAQARLWALARRSGYVRSPEAFAQLGWNWALSGRRGVAVARLQKAVAIADEEKQNEMKGILASAYMMQNEREKGEALYRELLAQNPKNKEALLGLARLSLLRGHHDEATTLLNQAMDAGVPAGDVELDLAMVLASRGMIPDAKQRVEKLLENNPEHLRGWVALAILLGALKDEDGVQNCLSRMGAIRGSAPYVAAIRADVAIRQNDLMTARTALEQVLVAMPNSTRTLETLLRLDMAQRQTTFAEAHAHKLLNLDAENSIGNFVMGGLHFSKGELDLAEDSYRASLKTHRSAAAMNDLAWVLTEKKDYTGAEKLARDVIALDENMYQAWDTLGVVLMRTGRLDESAKALEKSLSLVQSDPGVFLHLAELRVVRGEKDRALELIQMLYGKADLMSAADQQKLNEISRSLSAGAPKKE